MILLLGGTSETAPLAEALLAQGWSLLVSTATDAPLALPEDPLLQRRSGRLSLQQMIDLIRSCNIKQLVDATHPFAVEAHTTAQTAAEAAGIPCLRWQRGETAYDPAAITLVATHDEAAQKAVEVGRPILLTTGSRNLTPYLQAATAAGVPLFARVLPHAESAAACQAAGLRGEQIIAARGPFSVADTVAVIRDHAIGVLVSKESGSAGGLPEKLEAASQTGCRVVLLQRPLEHRTDLTCATTIELIHALQPLRNLP